MALRSPYAGLPGRTLGPGEAQGVSGAASAIAMLRLPVKEKVQTNQLEHPHQRRFRDRRLYREMHRDAEKK